MCQNATQRAAGIWFLIIGAVHVDGILGVDEVGALQDMVAYLIQVFDILRDIVTDKDEVSVVVVEYSQAAFSDPLGRAEFEVVWTALDELVVDAVLVVDDAEVASADELMPILASLAGWHALQVARIKRGETNLGHHAWSLLPSLAVDRDENWFTVERIWCRLVGIDSRDCTRCGVWKKAFGVVLWVQPEVALATE
ncbi:hypothetical protein AC579_1574 [Pseudocercospora musae]|uniref:Uncharacterized protein n=1 Tax=Pseudocercospora musae TaxID=113226 RepID=A0A139I1Y3_9PEZI|nr:hypothetical protein AC579_1574 [Pseudocercospora musae]